LLLSVDQLNRPLTIEGFRKRFLVVEAAPEKMLEMGEPTLLLNVRPFLRPAMSSVSVALEPLEFGEATGSLVRWAAILPVVSQERCGLHT
jgi:hypothetical protein